MAADPHELVDLLDDDANVIGNVSRAEMRARVLLHRSVGVLVLSARCELLLHRRADDKDVWPGYWDLAVGGVVAAGEASLDAARREAQEEVGLSPHDGELRHLGAGRFDDALVRTVADLYAVTARPGWQPTCVDGEVAETRWADWPTLAALLAEHRWCPDSMRLALPFAVAALAPRVAPGAPTRPV